MSTYEHATARAPLPYTEAVLREIDVVPERHHVKRHVSSNTARFDVGAANETEPPVVTTRLIRAHGCVADHAWQVEVSVDGGQLRRTPPPALKVVQEGRLRIIRAI